MLLSSCWLYENKFLSNTSFFLMKYNLKTIFPQLLCCVTSFYDSDFFKVGILPDIGFYVYVRRPIGIGRLFLFLFCHNNLAFMELTTVRKKDSVHREIFKNSKQAIEQLSRRHKETKNQISFCPIHPVISFAKTQQMARHMQQNSYRVLASLSIYKKFTLFILYISVIVLLFCLISYYIRTGFTCYLTLLVFDNLFVAIVSFSSPK